ncbi:MAG: TonB-dependent receptor [Hyphomonadaceae bacterium]
MGTTKRLTWLLSASLAISAATGAAHAQQSPPPEAPAETEAAPDEPLLVEQDDDGDAIVVTAQRGDQIRIDRRTYTLRDDATAQSTNMFDVLGRIPSVSVAPSGTISLLGAENVTIQINGQPVPGANLEQVLRGIPGSEVERIEVITNPGAQQSASTSGGVINIITRQRFDSGFNGTIQASGDSLGSYHVGVAPSWSRGDWSFSGQVGRYAGGNENDLTRTREILPAGPTTFEQGARSFDYEGWYASRLTASYRASERRRLSAALDSGTFSFEQAQNAALSDLGGPVSTQNYHADNEHQFNQITLSLRQDGEQPREQLRFDAAFFRFVQEMDATYRTTPAGAGAVSEYATMSDSESAGANITLDFERPLPNDRFLTFGGALEHNERTIDNALAIVSGPGPLPYSTTLEGSEQTLAAYTTFQFVTGDWTWLPGLRAESNRREVVSGGAETDETDTRLFPSIHLRRQLTRDLNLDVSYSSRIQRPDVQQLDPALRFVDVNRAISGNPNLDPTTTDAYEANLVYQRSGANFSLTFYDRISDDIVSQFTELTPGGVTIVMPVNAGTSEQRGLQALLRGPLGEHWRYSVNGNVLNREFDVLSGGVLIRRDELEYDGNVQLEYRDADQNAAGADQLQFEVRFQGPRHGLQSVQDEFIMANFTWRRRLTERLAAVLTVQDVFDSIRQTSEVTTDDYFERTEFRGAGTRFRLAFTYQFGSGPQRPLQDQREPAPPVPM